MNLVDYNKYLFSKKEKLVTVCTWGVLSIIIGYSFYENLIAIFILFALLPFVMKVRKVQLIEKRKINLRNQFKDALLAISSALTTGYSIENSIREAYRDIVLLYGENADISIELKNMVCQIELNKNIENLFEDFAKRSEVEDIKYFYEILSVAKRTGGNIIEAIQNTTDNICEKIEIKKEIEIMVSSKKFEQNIMNVVPILMILYVRISSPGFLNVMYETILGKVIMTICLLVYGIAYFLSIRILRINM
ncbi:MAG: type II secretion system F family protein [Eubacterium sp.]